LIAERLHRLSTRWDEPLVTLNCAALPETLIEAELFGHEAGAFTGATKSRTGRFEEADRGTLFLDELGTLSMGAQERLLRAVEYGEVTRIGAHLGRLERAASELPEEDGLRIAGRLARVRVLVECAGALATLRAVAAAGLCAARPA
jgi:sigma54-dependent transcription regulator